MVHAIHLASAGNDESRRMIGIETLFYLAQQPDLRDRMADNGALNVLLDVVADPDMLGTHGQLLAIGAIGMIAYVTDVNRRVRKIFLEHAGGIDALVAVASHRNMQGTFFQHKTLEALWSICCAKQVFH